MPSAMIAPKLRRPGPGRPVAGRHGAAPRRLVNRRGKGEPTPGGGMSSPSGSIRAALCLAHACRPAHELSVKPSQSSCRYRSDIWNLVIDLLRTAIPTDLAQSTIRFRDRGLLQPDCQLPPRGAYRPAAVTSVTRRRFRSVTPPREPPPLDFRLISIDFTFNPAQPDGIVGKFVFNKASSVHFDRIRCARPRRRNLLISHERLRGTLVSPEGTLVSPEGTLMSPEGTLVCTA